MRRLAAACLLAAVSTATAADPPLKAGFGFQAPAKEGDKKPAEKKDGDKKDDEKKAVAPTPIKPAGAAAQAPAAAKEPTRADRLKAAKEQYANQCASFVDYLHRQDSEKEKIDALKFAPTPAFAAGTVARLVLADPTDDVAFDGLAWLMRYKSMPAVAKVLDAVPPAIRGGKPAKLDVAAALLEHHVHNPKLAGVVGGIEPLNAENDKFLRTVIEKTKETKVKADAGVQLADLLHRGTEKPDLPAADREKALAAAETLIEKLLEDKALADLKYRRDSNYAAELSETLREVRTLTVGKKLPAVKGETLEGSQVSTEDYKGKVLVLDIWATWCGPCRAMIPHEREMTKKLKDKPFAFVSVSCDAEKETLTKFLEKEPMPWAHWFDGQNGKVNKALNVKFYPTVFVIDAKGVVRYKNVREHELEHAVEKLLAEAGSSTSGGR